MHYGASLTEDKLSVSYHVDTVLKHCIYIQYQLKICYTRKNMEMRRLITFLLDFIFVWRIFLLKFLLLFLLKFILSAYGCKIYCEIFSFLKHLLSMQSQEDFTSQLYHRTSKQVTNSFMDTFLNSTLFNELKYQLKIFYVSHKKKIL